MTATTSDAFASRVRWSWLWTAKTDLLWNLLPFWLGFLLVAALWVTRGTGPSAEDPGWTLSVAGRTISIMSVMIYLYGPLVDAPHLWGTIARTYTDPGEWAARRGLLLGSLVIFLIGPAVILLPYALRALGLLPSGAETFGWQFWSVAIAFYAIFHINRQHWGFVALYRRKNGEVAAPAQGQASQTNNDTKDDARWDAIFFQIAIWLPYFAMLTAPWYLTIENKPVATMQIAVGSTTVGSILYTFCHVAFFAICAAYALFQFAQWRKGVARNGPKLIYVATILSLYYVTFALHPRLAAFWVLITSTGHCAQYHAVVWAYGRKKYVGGEPEKKRGLTAAIFGHVWLYIVLGLAFGLVTAQGPGSGLLKRTVGQLLDANVFARAFDFLDRKEGLALGIKVAASVVAGVRLHHFFVDSKIWRVGKSPALAKNLNL